MTFPQNSPFNHQYEQLELPNMPAPVDAPTRPSRPIEDAEADLDMAIRDLELDHPAYEYVARALTSLRGFLR